MPYLSQKLEPNFLFGVLALHRRLIDQVLFADACAGWAVSRDRPLTELLVEHRQFTAEVRAAIKCFARLDVETHQGDSPAKLDASAGPEALASILASAAPLPWEK